MWSIFFACALLSSAYARTTVHIPKISVEALDSTIILDATGSITDNNVENITGTILVQQAPFSVGVSRSSETISALLGYSQELAIPSNTSSIVADVDVNTQISTQSGSGSVSVSSSSYYGNPQATVQGTVTKEGVTNYGLGVSVGSSDDIVQVNAQLNGVQNEGFTVQGTTQIGPVAASASRSAAGLWDEKLGTRLTLLTNPQIILIGGLHQNTSNQLDYVLGIESPVASAIIQINADKTIDYNLKGTLNGTQDNIPYTITASGAYLASTGTVPYTVSATAGPVTGILSGTLFDDYSLQLIVDFYIFEVSFNLGINGTPSYNFEVELNDANVQLLLNENFQATNLIGSFWTNALNLSAQTDFNGDYNLSVQVDEEVA